MPLPLTSLAPELMIQIASSLDPRTVLALTHTCPMFAYLLCVFNREYTIDQDISGHSYTPLQYFVSRGIERVVIHLLEQGTDPNQVVLTHSKRQTTPLILAVHLQSASMVSLLLQYGASVDDQGCTGNDCDESTPLPGGEAGNAVIQYDNPSVRERSSSEPPEIAQIIHLLLDAGADVEAAIRGDRTPLHIACCI
ncbi:hypothetical protein Q9L58_005885 [Maublancomyces gigas]|uniref:Uncharacterized protein n=1 Tax=Discina gigas TaxID=1032678 RepID=A0ABR3GGY2_9PEZI